MVRVEGKTPGGRTPIFAPFEFEPDFEHADSNDFRVRDLITKLVFESVRDFHLREKDTALKAMTNEEIAQGVIKGKIGRAREEAQRVDIERATAQALQAFVDGLYLLFVDKIEKRSLDERVTLGLDTQITLIRLTALAGR